MQNYTSITHFKLTYTSILHPRDTGSTDHRSKTLFCECAIYSPSAHSLIEKLKPLWPTLHSLDITTNDITRRDSTKSIGAVSTLRHFTKLTHLSIPFWFICPIEHPSWHVLPLGQGNPLQVLPSLMQVLTIYNPDGQVFTYLAQLFTIRHRFPDLREIVLEN
jgi:hypothetical protein